MILDANLVFWGTAPYASASNYVSLATLTVSTSSQVINLGAARDLGDGSGQAVPKVLVQIGTAITSSSSGLRINMQFQGSTDSTNWTTYVESGALATSAYTASSIVFPIDVPQRPAGAALPTYYRLNAAFTGTTNESVSSGTILAGILIDRPADSAGAQYASGFTVI